MLFIVRAAVGIAVCYRSVHKKMEAIDNRLGFRPLRPGFRATQVTHQCRIIYRPMWAFSLKFFICLSLFVSVLLLCCFSLAFYLFLSLVSCRKIASPASSGLTACNCASGGVLYAPVESRTCKARAEGKAEKASDSAVE